MVPAMRSTSCHGRASSSRVALRCRWQSGLALRADPHLQAGAKVVRATAAAAAQAGVRAGAKAGVDAGARYGAQHVLQNSRIRRTVERDEQGRITGTIESREPAR
jgi:hypothetical protein